MFHVVRRTWLAGADPTDKPDMCRPVATASTREAAEARAEALAKGFREPRFDGRARCWWAKAANALHEFAVEEREASR